MKLMSISRRLVLALSLCAFAPLVLGAGKTILIDVRTPAEYAEGHLSGAINIDHESIGQQISRAQAGKDDEIILYCRSGRRSAIALETLKGMGYHKINDYGGIEAARKRLEGKQAN